jgi:hypothetical protein
MARAAIATASATPVLVAGGALLLEVGGDGAMGQDDDGQRETEGARLLHWTG